MAKKMQTKLVFQRLTFIVMVCLMVSLGLVANEAFAGVITLNPDGIFVATENTDVTSLDFRVAGPVVGESGKLMLKNIVAPTTAGDVEMFSLENSGNKIVRFKIQAGGGYSIWTFDNEPTYNGSAGFNSGRFRISKQGSGVSEFSVDGYGNGIFYAKSYATEHINTSARDAKTDFQPLNEREILAKVMQLPVSQWRYKQEGKDARHIGPVAEDFHEVFGLGDDKHISTVDSEGIALAAIKAIKTEKDAEIVALKEDNRMIKEENRVLAERLKVLEELVLGRRQVTQLIQ